MNYVFALGLGYSVMQAFEPTVIIEHEAIIGGLKCLYWLVKNEIAHHTNYPKLLSLAQLLGCDYFEKLKVNLLQIDACETKNFNQLNVKLPPFLRWIKETITNHTE